MNKETMDKLEFVKKTQKEMEIYGHACRVLSYDQETICPPKALEAQGEVSAYLQNLSFKLAKDEKYIEAAEYLY